MTRLILIDSRIPDVESITATLTDGTDSLIFDYQLDTLETIQTRITTSYESIAIAQHKYNTHNFKFVKSMYPASLVSVEQVDSELTTWGEFISFLHWLKINGAINIDWLACDLWSDENWKYVILKIRESTGMTIRASIDITGADGNFVLESDNVDMVGIYFTPEISNYKYNFYSSATPYDSIGFINYSQITFPSTNVGSIPFSSYNAVIGYVVGGKYNGEWYANAISAGGVSNVSSVYMTDGAYAVLKSDGTVYAYGDYKYSTNVGNYGGDVSAIQSQLTNVIKMAPLQNGFAALKSNGTVISWGMLSSPGTYYTASSNNFVFYSDISNTLVGITDIVGSYNAIYALTNTGKVISFGVKTYLPSNIPAIASYLNSGVVKIKTSRDNVIFIKSDGSAYFINGNSNANSLVTTYNTNPIIDACVFNTSTMSIYSVYIRTSGTTKQLTNITGSFLYYTMPEGVYVVKHADHTASGGVYKGLLLLSNNVLLVITSNNATPVIITNVSEFEYNETAYAYIKNGTVYVSGAANSGGDFTNTYYGLPIISGTTRVSLTNVRRLVSATNSFGAITFNNEFIWWGAVYEPYRDYYWSSQFKTQYAKSTALYNAFSSNIASVYGCAQGYIITKTDGSIISFGTLGVQYNNSTSQYGTKNTGKNVLFVPNAAGFIPIDITPVENVSLSQTEQYIPTTVSYYNSNPDVMAIRGRKYSLYSGTTVLSTWYCTADSLTYVFSNVMFMQSGTLSISVYDTPDFVGSSKKLVGTINASIVANTTATVPGAPTITSISTAVNQITVNFTPPASNGGTTIINYKYSINSGSTYTTIASTSSQIVLTGMTNPSYIILLRAVSYVGESAYTEQVVYMYPILIPDVPTILSITPGNNSFSVVIQNPPYNHEKPIDTYEYSLNGGNYANIVNITLNPESTEYIAVFNNGVVNGSPYSIQIRSRNTEGTSTPTNPTDMIYPFSLPDAPIIGTITNGNQTATIAFTSATNTGGFPIIYYTYLINDADPVVITQAASITISNLEIGTEYEVKIQSMTSKGDSPYATTTILGRSVPNSPQITSIVAGMNTATVYFTAPFANYSSITGYAYSIVDGSFVSVTLSGESSFIISGLTANVLYPVKTIAINAIGNSIASNMVEVLPYTYPIAPLIGNIDSVNGTATISFTPQSNNGSEISDFLYSINNGSYSSIPEPFTLSNLTNGVRYTLRMKAVNLAGSSLVPSIASFLSSGVPDSPIILGITVGNKSVQVDFIPGANNGSQIKKYQYSLNGTNFTDAIDLLSPMTILGLTNGTEYTVYLRARNDMGVSIRSLPSASFTPFSVQTTPNPPTIASVIAGDRRAEIIFEDGSNTGSSLKGYLYSIDNGASYKWADQTGSTITITNGLENGTSYTVLLTAVNDSGPSDPSAPSSVFTPSAKPSTPYILSVQGEDSSIHVIFTDSSANGSEITEYKYSINGGEFFSFYDETNRIYGLTNGTSYVVRVCAINAVGSSDPSYPSIPVYPFRIPDAPVINQVESMDTKLRVLFTPGNINGSVISYYEYALAKDSEDFSPFKPAPSLVSPFEISGLENGAEYSIMLRAVSSLNVRSESSETLGPIIPCGIPQRPVITGVIPGDSSLSISYISDSNGSEITHIMYSVNDGQVMLITGNTNPFLITGLINGISYYVKMYTLNIAGMSFVSYANANNVPVATPESPTITSVVPSDSKIQVNFSAGNFNGSSFNGYKYSVNGGEYGWAYGTQSPITIAGLTNGTPYIVKLKAVSEKVGDSPESNASSSVIPYRSPDAPTIQTITPGNGSATVVFVNGSLNGLSISGYKYSLDENTYHEITATTVNNKLQMVISGLNNGTEYTVRIKTATSVVDSVPSILSAPFMPFTNPSKPVIGTLVPGDKMVSVHFTDGALNGSGSIEGYQYTLDGTTYLWASSTSSPIMITSGLQNNQSYNVKILAKTAKGISAFSEQSPAFIPYTVPDAPTIQSVTPGNGSVSVYYTNGQTNGGRSITNYQYSINGGAFANAVVGSPIHITGLTNATSYIVVLKSVNAAGSSLASIQSDDFIPFTVPNAPTITNVVPSANQATVFITSGSSNGSAITKYNYSINGGQFISTADASTTFVISGLTNGTSYSISVNAENAAGQGSASSTYTNVIPFTTPDAPTITSVSVSNGSAIVYITNGNTNGRTITHYQYTYSDETTSTTITTTAQSSFTITGLTNWNTYTVKVCAINVAGASVASSNSEPFMPYNIPGAPEISSVVPGNATITVIMNATTIGEGVIGYRYSFDNTTYIYKSGEGLSFTITENVVNGESYIVYVKSVTSLGDSVVSMPSSQVIPFSEPNAPTITSVVSGNKTTTIGVSNGNNNGRAITHYEYSYDGINYIRVDAISPIIVSNLSNWEAYSFYVKAVNVAGRSPPSTVSESVVPFLVPTSASIASIVPGNSQLTVIMNGYTTDAGIIGYKYSTNGTEYTFAESSSDSFAISSLVNGENYTIYAKLSTSAGDSPESSPFGPIYPRAPPSPPTNVVVTPFNESASISFIDGSANGAVIERYAYSLNGEIDIPVKKREDGTIRIFSLINATVNTVRLRAINSSGQSNYSEVSNSFIPFGVPRPTTITQIIPGNNSAYVYFEDIDTNGSPLTKLKYSLGGSAIDVSGLTSPLTIPGLVNKTAYNISLVACNAAGDSVNSNALPIIVGVPTVPVITEVVESAKKLLVYFDAPISDNGSPITQYMFGFVGTTALTKATTTTSPLQIANLKNGLPYNVYICAVNKNGNSKISNNVGAKVPREPPAKITVSSVSPGLNSAMVYFTTPLDNGAPILKYKYVINANTEFIDISNTTLPLRISNIPINTNFTVKVIATNIAGDSIVSAPSKPAMYTYLPPGQVKTPTAVMPTRNSMLISFVAPALNGSPIITYKYALLPTDTVFTDISSNVLPLLITEGVVPNVNYLIRIIAVNSAGESIPSIAPKVPISTMYLPPVAPTITSVVGGNQSAVVNFTSPALRGAPIIGYAYTTDTTGTLYTIVSGAVSPLTIPDLVNDTSYNVRIAAVTDAGNSVWSLGFTVIPVYKVPNIPIIATVVAGVLQLTVNFTTLPLANGSPITEYKYTLDNGVKISAPLIATGKTFSIIITKNIVDDVEVPLTVKLYSVKVCATNSLGDSDLSLQKTGTPKAV